MLLGGGVVGEEEGMGPRLREDTEGSTRTTGRGARTREGRGEVGCGGAIDSSLRFATFRMTCGGRCARNDMWGALRTGGSGIASRRRGCGGGRGDGSPHSRGNGMEVREQREGARGHGRERRGWLWGSDRFFTSLRYVQNDMGGRCAWKDMWLE